MRRTKEWWATLNAGERSELVGLERASAWTGAGGGWNLPPGFSDCHYCSTPARGELCDSCLDRLIALIEKADTAVIAAEPMSWSAMHGIVEGEQI